MSLSIAYIYIIIGIITKEIKLICFKFKIAHEAVLYVCAMCEHVCKYVYFVTQKAFIPLLGFHISFNLMNNIGLCLLFFYVKISYSQYEGISFKSDNLSSLANNQFEKIT